MATRRWKARIAVVAGALCIAAAAAVAVLWWQANRPRTDEERLALAIAELDGDSLLEEILEEFGLQGDRPPSVQEAAQRLSGAQGDRAIPYLIGAIDADNSSDTKYRIGYFVLRPLTGVEWSPLHDGAWWRRWWAENRRRFSPAAAERSIPDWPKTRYGRQAKPLPANIDTLEGKLALIPEVIKESDASQSGIREPRVTLANLAEAIAGHDDPRAIPHLIGLLEADNSHATRTPCNKALERLTGVKRSRFHDSVWWRRWWAENKDDLPPEVAAAPIPNYPKTWVGIRYESPWPEDIDTLQGKLRMLTSTVAEVRKLPPARVNSMIWADLASEIADHDDPRAIPFLIGVIAADPTGSSVYGVGYFGLRPLTGVEFSEAHDGPWWLDWWERNRSNFPAEVSGIDPSNFDEPLTFPGKDSAEATAPAAPASLR